jgi:prophage maintenance system killer protein
VGDSGGSPGRFEECLAEATAPEFFHPFDDGNARSAMLALYYVLAREDVVLDHAAPVVRVSRVAHDAVGAVALAALVEVLITSTRRRMRP